MEKNWHKKGVVQAAMILTIGTLVVFFGNLWNQRSSLRSDNETLSRDLDQTKESLHRTETERNTALTRLDPFLVQVGKRLPGVPEDKRLDALLEKFDNMLAAVEQGLLELEDVIGSLGQPQPPSGDRSLSPSAVQQLTTSLKEFSEWEVKTAYQMGDAEASPLAEQIEAVFTEAGWTVKGVSQVVLSRPARQLYVRVSSLPPKTLQLALVPLFDDLGYPRKIFLDPSVPDKTINIVVGTK